LVLYARNDLSFVDGVDGVDREEATVHTVHE
jgi:hypothetical protein